MKILTNSIAIISILSLLGCKTKTSSSHEGEVFVNIKTIRVPGGWGYQLYVDTTLYIDQPFIPVISGHQPFATEEDAKKVAHLVLDRVSKQETPALDSADLINLGIIRKK